MQKQPSQPLFRSILCFLANNDIERTGKVFWRTLKAFSITSMRKFCSLFLCCRHTNMEIIQFALLDHVRHSWAECLLKETPNLLIFLHKIPQSVHLRGLSCRVPCSSYLSCALGAAGSSPLSPAGLFPPVQVTIGEFLYHAGS